MIQPLRSVMSTIRSSALRTFPSATNSTSSRPMVSAAASPIDGSQSRSIGMNIFDIFDAPSRLGESSRLLVANAAASAATHSARPFTMQASAQGHVVKPLPPPILLDGPARPRHRPFVSFRAFGVRAKAPVTSRVAPSGVETLAAPLPSPIIFDGPSRLRPYVRRGARGNGYSTALVKSATPMALALVAGVALFVIDPTTVASIVGPSSNNSRGSAQDRLSS
ncbi:hypothetical protein DICSQDRAFT_157771 [Dichomitus squalens LYAD-421 SS1]|uniref:Uncharacterized protein n=1 Tax=Dichomitus squalens (strain LYAD-421) TaxID=732165 RepID=R7SKP2_DICSQ|nr:uncharacterized protein DICSQDRAFT_157771 [Dichomitus squalens LYAD-421 SS1]EJF56706.1 hypothetical protein DICSQDRAFT_157771 [Dichomitus squalens LYAD-421 SS1]